MLRKFAVLLMSLTLCWTTLACGSAPPPTPQTSQTSQNRDFNTSSAQTRLTDGQYSVQQANYDDANGEYTLMLLDTPSGAPPIYRTTDLQMARLTDAEVSAGKKSYLEVKNGQPALHLTEDFKIAYTHNVTQTQPNPQTGQPQTVVVRQESSFWAPFAGAIAGQVVGNLLFSPRYYVPPVYQPGGIMMGYGGYGNTYGQAVDRYQTRYQAPPAAVRNRQVFRSTGRLRNPSISQPTPVRRTPQYGNRSTGTGYGTSTLRRSNQSSPSRRVDRPSGFGSGTRSRARSRRR